MTEPNWNTFSKFGIHDAQRYIDLDCHMGSYQTMKKVHSHKLKRKLGRYQQKPDNEAITQLSNDICNGIVKLFLPL